MSELHSQDQLPTCTCMRKCDVRAQVGRRCRALNLPVTPSKTAESVEGTSLTDLADQVDQVAKLLENVVGHQDPDSFTIGAAVADLNGIARRLRGGRPLSQGAPSTPSYRFGCPRGRDGCNTPGECGAALRCCRAEAEKNGGGAST